MMLRNEYPLSAWQRDKRADQDQDRAERACAGDTAVGGLCCAIGLYVLGGVIVSLLGAV